MVGYGGGGVECQGGWVAGVGRRNAAKKGVACIICFSFCTAASQLIEFGVPCPQRWRRPLPLSPSGSHCTLRGRNGHTRPCSKWPSLSLPNCQRLATASHQPTEHSFDFRSLDSHYQNVLNSRSISPFGGGHSPDLIVSPLSSSSMLLQIFPFVYTSARPTTRLLKHYTRYGRNSGWGVEGDEGNCAGGRCRGTWRRGGGELMSDELPEIGG